MPFKIDVSEIPFKVFSSLVYLHLPVWRTLSLYNEYLQVDKSSLQEYRGEKPCGEEGM